MPTGKRPSPASTGAIADALWRRYRAVVDARLPAVADAPGCYARHARGALYLFLANRIAEWVDRIETEPDPVLRDDLAAALLGKPPHEKP